MLFSYKEKEEIFNMVANNLLSCYKQEQSTDDYYDSARTELNSRQLYCRAVDIHEQ